MTAETLSFETVLPKLAEAYAAWKEREAEKNEAKDQFFQLADADIEDRGGAMKVVSISAKSEDSAVERAKRHYPAWLIDDHREHPWHDGIYEVIIKENPALQPYSTEYNGYKYARTISKGPVMLDEEWLQEEAPELYQEVTFELPWGARVAVPVEQLDKDQFARLHKYIYNDKPRVTLRAPAPVKGD